MRIGFDGKRLVFNNTGLGNYSRFLVETLSDTFPENQYLIFSKKTKDNPRLNRILQHTQIRFKTPSGFLSRWFPSLWRSCGIKKDLQREKIDLYHGLSHEIPFKLNTTSIPSVVTVHDLIYLRFPKYYSLIDRTIYRFKTRYACRHADKIIATSECTKRDIIHYFGISPEKIDVVYQDCDPIFKKKYSLQEVSEIQKKYNLPKHFILSVGSIEERKNLLLTVKALASCEKELHLVVIGRKTVYFDTVYAHYKQLGLTDRIHILENLPFQDLPLIYQQAKALVYPSRYEGFGIPIIEALYSGIPVIAATGSCLEEAGGPNSLYIYPDDETALSEAISSITQNEQVAESMKKNGKTYVQRFEPQKIAKDVMNVYLSVLNIP